MRNFREGRISSFVRRLGIPPTPSPSVYNINLSFLCIKIIIILIFSKLQDYSASLLGLPEDYFWNDITEQEVRYITINENISDNLFISLPNSNLRYSNIAKHPPSSVSVKYTWNYPEKALIVFVSECQCPGSKFNFLECVGEVISYNQQAGAGETSSIINIPTLSGRSLTRLEIL